jgi:uncharacterized protein YbjT (DUF2867 family)
MGGLVTVFGGSGFIGTYVVRALARRGWRVRVAVRRPQLAYKLRPYGDVGQIQLVQANVAVPETVERALEGADACINLVGILYQTPGRSFRRVHVEGSRTVADACAAAGITDLVQVSALGADPQAASEYARSKGEAEEAVKKRVPSARIVRPSLVFGPEDDLFNRFAGMTNWSPFLPLVGGGKTKFQPVYVIDVASAIVACLEGAAPGAYELGGPETFSFRQLMEMVTHEIGKGRVLLPLPWTVASLIGLAGDLQALLQPFAPKPLITSDQVMLLHADNVVSGDAPGLEALGIVPTGVESILPTYLWRYRRGGQFAAAPVR